MRERGRERERECVRERQRVVGYEEAERKESVTILRCIKSCLEEGLRPVCFEASKEIGGLWVYRDSTDQVSYRKIFY